MHVINMQYMYSGWYDHAHSMVAHVDINTDGQRFEPGWEVAGNLPAVEASSAVL